ncbi:hypothetical protein [Paraburkholderia atlantica]|uniref:hypothetical protein n=1 Tax=Paraburkholderia atlantica TaxID=2654982 RepID=UPI0016178E6E|nr:hypothetical protein [Paraburkholderia atlantica]MBB5509582.1 hypothetical protein [Paraburkholderia atlantica]
MSKQSEAKETQGWRKLPDTCSTCIHFSFERIEEKSKWGGSAIYITEKNLRCTLGGFKTGKSNVCDYHKLKEVGKS